MLNSLAENFHCSMQLSRKRSWQHRENWEDGWGKRDFWRSAECWGILPFLVHIRIVIGRSMSVSSLFSWMSNGSFCFGGSLESPMPWWRLFTMYVMIASSRINAARLVVFRWSLSKFLNFFDGSLGSSHKNRKFTMDFSQVDKSGFWVSIWREFGKCLHSPPR